MRISVHAVLRYLERRHGIDVKAARREMAVAVDQQFSFCDFR